MKHAIAAALLASAALAGSAQAQGSGTVNLAYVEWSDTVVATNILAAVLEDEGYTVNMTPLPGAAMWQAVATGEADAHVAGWLPVTHAAYYEELQDQLEVLEPNIEGARLGWAVPEYMDISSIEDIAADPSVVNGQVIGIDPGAGLMAASERAIEDYDLDVTLVEGTDATMTAALQDAISREEPIVVTAWTPHWMFSRFDLKYLEDPQVSLGEEETVHNVVRAGLQEDMPDVYRIISNFRLTLPDEEAIMLENEEGADPAETARAWVDANPDTVAEWTAE
ncbi:glycine betaine ABC transporter substrate-binding protein [Aureimonas mangrovi]|uniref:glycine betaine ABC transporter substrate-binding protein n=1 Tax=Aureimonas mangrovi TaxID=2758041 RepID=UPI00163DCC88|nr:glycine betaine ABC transporter substrate-binding protein [Aureimonas mangrovi]